LKTLADQAEIFLPSCGIRMLDEMENTTNEVIRLYLKELDLARSEIAVAQQLAFG